MNKIIRVNMTEQRVWEEEAPKEFLLLGGRSLIDRILTTEVDPTDHPLGKGNKLIFAPGLFAATPVPNANRLSIGGKSPLTNGIKEANGGGTAAHKLARLDIKALIIEGKPENGPFILVIKKDSITIEPANGLSLLGNYELCARLRKQYGDVAVLSIGPCGERRMCGSSIAVTDMNGYPTRHCARGGLGAVMGAKGLKAIVINDTGGSNQKAANPDVFKEAAKEGVDLIRNNPRFAFFQAEGTAGIVTIASARGSFPTRNYRSGTFEGVEGLSSKKIIELQKERGGSMGHACSPGCIVRCSNVYYDSKKEYLTSGFEYETLGMLGANLGIGDMDAVATMDRKCDDYGIDTIEMGSAIGVLSETEFFEFGNKEKALELVDEIGKGSILGRILGQGVATTCRVFGIDRVPAVKGQAIPAHEPRGVKGVGVTYATSPQGADHTAGYVGVELLSPEGHAERSRTMQYNMAFLDSSGFCYYTFLGGQWSFFVKLIKGLYGIECREADLLEIAKSVITEELDFNKRTSVERLPKFLFEEKLEPIDSLYDVPKGDLEAVHLE